jgi:hypothetical protein
MRVEIYGKSLTQKDRTVNEDAFMITREPIPVAAVCDGAGNAEQAARKVLRLFEFWVREATAKEFTQPATCGQLLRARRGWSETTGEGDCPSVFGISRRQKGTWEWLEPVHKSSKGGRP